MMQRWGGFVAYRAKAVLAIGVAVVIAAAVYGVGVFGVLGQGGFDDPTSESAHQLAAEQTAFGGHDTDVVAIYSSDDLQADDPEFVTAVTRVVDELPTSAVAHTVPYYATTGSGLVSNDGHAAMVVLRLEGQTQDDRLVNFDVVKDRLTADGLTTNVGGPWAVFDDVNETVSADIARAESISMPIVFLLCLLIFGSVVSALMPGLIGGVAVFGALAVVRLVTTVTDVSIFAINIITLIGMGLAIDYALFVVSRFREELARQDGTDRQHVDAAVVSTMMTAGRTVLFSGLTVAASLASLLIFPQNFLRSMGYGGVAAVLVAMLTALTLLPALLAVLGTRIEFGAMPWRRRRLAGAPAMSGAWARIGHSVMRRPVAYLAVIVVALLALGAPFLSAKWGSVDYRVLPPDSPSHVAAKQQADEFGGERSTANVVVSGADDATLSTYADRLRAVDGVTSVEVLEEAAADSQPGALLQANWAGNGQTQRSQDIVKQLRAVDPGGDARALVGGTSAETVDLVDSIGAHLPWMGLLVVAVMLVLLFLAFGSVVLPIKAVAMNAISIAASFGVVTWIFQDGHLAGLLGFTSPGFLDATQPILMLGILFGLSMDYEVFLLSRVREEWDRTHDNTAAVAIGLQRSGAIITSAAVLLAVVIGGFATSGIVFMKMIGIGMLVAVLLDATVVRALLVPATMRLLGAANWWAPGPLRRWWDRHGLREHDAAPADTARVSEAELVAR
ncbi:MAG: MMPL family transporter [Nocardioidaceae bacterium]|nr:MMPL family transporter [Nocardioidaceae bacterium]